MRKAVDVDNIDIDDLIATVMNDPAAISGANPQFKGLNLNELISAYKEFCKNAPARGASFDLGQVIDFYNQAVADLPDPAKLKGLKLPGASVVLDIKGQRFAEIFEQNQRRVWVPLAKIPDHVQKAFISAEDKRFYQHKGIDERSLIRAFFGNLAQAGRPQGGSTISQQVVKNLLVGNDLTYERKMREMIVTSRMEHVLSKSEILEIYLNLIYLGRGAWGVEKAAGAYFGKPASALSVSEGAFLAGLTKGPHWFSPDRHADRAQERYAYVLTRLHEDGLMDMEETKRLILSPPKPVAYENPRRRFGLHFIDQLTREAKAVAGIEALTANSYTVRSTVSPTLQRATEIALQEGLVRYEMQQGRVKFKGPEANLAEAVRRIEAERSKGEQLNVGSAALEKNPDRSKGPTGRNKAAAQKSKRPPHGKAEAPSVPMPRPRPEPAAASVLGPKPPWQLALEAAHLPLYDVHWSAAIVLQAGSGRQGEMVTVGLADGRVLPLARAPDSIRRSLKLHDVIFVQMSEPGGKGRARAELRVRPEVQGAAVVLENKTGRMLAVTGGFSYPLSQLNRATQSVRQPGSAIKSLVYLEALQKGLQPNTLLRDQSITLPPIGPGPARPQDHWTPKNFDGGESGIITVRRAIEHSRNLATLKLLDGGIDASPVRSLDRICALALEAQLYRTCERYFPFVLGAQPVRLIDLAAFYAAIANEGLRPTPYSIEAIENQGTAIYRRAPSLSPIRSADGVSFFQLKTMLQGVLARGTARNMADLAPYAAGKTGTSDAANDAWFVGFTNEVTVAVWVGYDNAEGRRTLGSGQTGAKIAAPIFKSIVHATWKHHAPRSALNGPSPETVRQIVSLPIELQSGDRIMDGRSGFTEHFRKTATGGIADTQHALVSREDAMAARSQHAIPHDVFAQKLWGRAPDRGGSAPQAPRASPQGRGHHLWRTYCASSLVCFARDDRKAVRRRIESGLAPDCNFTWFPYGLRSRFTYGQMATPARREGEALHRLERGSICHRARFGRCVR